MKKLLGILLFILSGLLAVPAWSSDKAPDRLVDETVKEVMNIIQKDEELKNGNKEKMLDLIETKILPHFNFTHMTQLAMGQHWSAASPDQQKKLDLSDKPAGVYFASYEKQGQLFTRKLVKQ